MSNKKLSVGGPIESRCTKCLAITNHIIVAMANGIPVKVECNTCKGQHKYRSPAEKKTPTARRVVAAKPSVQREWEALRDSSVGQQATPYSMTTLFKAGSAMQHPVFGLGFVLNSLGDGKVEVLFEDGKKKLRCM